VIKKLMEVFKVQGVIDLKDNLTSKIPGVKSKMGDVEKKAGGLGGGFAKLGGVIAGAFAVKKIIDFTGTLIETTAKIQAMDSQFSQVFKGAEGEQAISGINAQAKELGINGDRLKGAWSSFGAQVKGAGMDGTRHSKLPR